MDAASPAAGAGIGRDYALRPAVRAKEAFRRNSANLTADGLLAGLLKLSGKTDQAERILAGLRQMPPHGMIIHHLVCSEIDDAVRWYERAIEQRHPYAAEWASAAFLKPLRCSAQWPSLAARMNLPAQL